METSPAQRDWSGQFSGVWEQKAFLVLHESEWKDLWIKDLRKSPPEVALSEYFAAVVFVGNVPTGGYKVQFSEPETKDGKTYVVYRIVKPGKGNFVIQSFTQPYFIRLYKRSFLPVTLAETR